MCISEEKSVLNGTAYLNERPLLGSGGALIKSFLLKGGYSFERGTLLRGGAHLIKYGI